MRQWVDKGLSERRPLSAVRMSANALRYEPLPSRNAELRERILALAQQHKCYGVGMIYLKLRQAGLSVNYKRVERLYRERSCRCVVESARKFLSANGSCCYGPTGPMKCGR